VERCKQARPVVDRSGKPVLVETPDGSLLPAYTFEPQSVLKGAELLGKHLKLFTDKTEHTGPGGGDIAVKVDVTVSPSEGYLKMLGAGK
jgi:phage terminase small subunit